MNQRTELAAQIMTWRRIAHSDDPVFRSWPRDWILPDSSIILLARANPGDFATPNDIAKFLHENNDWHDSWANEIHAIIRDYDILINMNKPKRRRRTAPTSLPTEDEDDSLGPESEDEPDIYNQGESTKDDANDSNSDNDQDEPELYDNPQHESHCVCGEYGPPPEELHTTASQTHSPVPSRPPSPDTTINSHRRARTVTPPESPSAKTPSRPTKRRKLDNTTNTYRRSSRLSKQ